MASLRSGRAFLLSSSILSILLITTVQGRGFAHNCRIDNPIVELAKDSNGNVFILHSDDNADEAASPSDNTRRWLKSIKRPKPITSGLSEHDETTFVPAIQITSSRRRLQQQETDGTIGNDSNNNHTDTSNSTGTVSANNTNATIIVERYPVRLCNCVDNHYCPANLEYCARPYTFRENQTPGCMSKSRRIGLYGQLPTIFYVVWVWVAGLMVFLFFSQWGRSVFGYIFSAILPCYNELVAHLLLRRRPERARQLIRRNLLYRRRLLERRRWARVMDEVASGQDGRDNRRREGGNSETTGPNTTANSVSVEEGLKRNPTSLALRTRVFRTDGRQQKQQQTEEDYQHQHVNDSNGNVKMDDSPEEFVDEDNTCMICFMELLDGDRIGALPCNHTFHADCLKTWLRRRNVCPLCNSAKVATERFEDEDSPPNA